MKSRLTHLILLLVASHGVGAQTPSGSAVIRLDPALDDIVSVDAKAELLKGDYFGFTEGPVWV